MLLLRGGRVIDPANGVDKVQDVLLQDGFILEVGKGLTHPKARVMDVAGLLVSPGLIDLHVHLREPGEEHKETIASGTRAAAAGGFTTICAMPNTTPPQDTAPTLAFIYQRAEAVGAVRVLPIAAVTRGLSGTNLTDMADLTAAGAAAFSNDGHPVATAHVLRRALEYASMFGRTVIEHCEDPSLSAGGVMHEGPLSARLGLRGIPAAAEEVAVARAIILAELTGARLHLAHLSTAGSVRLLEDALARGVPVTAEVTPHHLVLSHEAVTGYDPNTKVNPPLRTAADVTALRAALARGCVAAIATDHAPHALEDKEVEYEAASFGLVGLETAVPLLATHLVAGGLLTWPQLLALWTTGPAGVLGRDFAGLVPGAPGDLTVIDPNLTREVRPESFLSQGRNTPFAGQKLTGWPVTTIVGGRLVYHEGRLLLPEGKGWRGLAAP